MDNPDADLRIAFARLEGKVDLALTQISAGTTVDADHEQRIRTVESKPIPDPSTEQRLRALEDRRTISPGQLWLGLVGVSTVLASVAGIYAAVTH